MSKKMDGDFADRLRKAAAHNNVPYSQAAIAAFLGIKNRQTIDPWMSGSIPRGDRIFEYADKFGGSEEKPDFHPRDAHGLGR